MAGENTCGAERKEEGGWVSLVGAGPGDPGLITVRGAKRLREAQVVVYDRLVDKRVLAEAPQDAELVYVGKASSHHTVPQAKINAMLIARARAGKYVVRLKGGDPFVFGRGGEEAEALVDAGIRFEVVPGVTSAVAAPAYAGIPVTHRGFTASFSVVTGHEDPTKAGSNIDWQALGHGSGTLVFLMSMSRLSSITEQLVRHGRDPRTPVALIRWGTWAAQETLVGTLADIATLAQEHAFRQPAVVVIGEVVHLREKIAWFDKRPLFGKQVLVTRTRAQAGALSQLLTEAGAHPIEVPVIRIEPPPCWEPLDSAIAELGSFHWVIFTSVNGVHGFFQRLRFAGRDARAFAGAKVAAIGPTTADALAGHGITPDFVPDEYVAEEVVSGLLERGVVGCKILVARAEEAREVLVSQLRNHGACVDEVPVYRTVPASDAGGQLRELLERKQLHAVTFASSSAVRNTVDLAGERAVAQLNELIVACMGPVTARAARDLGLRVDVVASHYTIPSLARALEEYFRQEV